MKKILVIGGSYFLGKSFVNLAGETCKITVVNRGNMSVPDENVRSYIADRHDEDALKRIPHDHYDAVVDFCAYNAGDISFLIECTDIFFEQYIFISTCDVYRRGTNKPMDENSEFEYRKFGGAAGEYISGKVALEDELKKKAAERGFAWTSIRPVFIYGPDNYAPRETMYFKWITGAGQIIHPENADGSFQMVYVEDVSRIILKCCGDAALYNRGLNICGPDTCTYDSFYESLLYATGIDIQKINLSMEEINGRGIPLPFPLTKEESNCYTTNMPEYYRDYMPLGSGLKETYEWYVKTYKTN